MALVKYTIEALTVYVLTNQFFYPLDFVIPWLSRKAPFLAGAPAAGLLWLTFTIPFVWIAIAMGVRRAADVRISPWVGLSPDIRPEMSFCDDVPPGRGGNAPTHRGLSD